MRRKLTSSAGLMLILAGCHSTQPVKDGRLFLSGRIDGDTIDIAPKIAGTSRPTRMPMITITISISMSVKPVRLRIVWRDIGRVSGNSRVPD